MEKNPNSIVTRGKLDAQDWGILQAANSAEGEIPATDIQDEVGISSDSTLHSKIDRLEKFDLVTTRKSEKELPGAARSPRLVEITEDGSVAVEEGAAAPQERVFELLERVREQEEQIAEMQDEIEELSQNQEKSNIDREQERLEDVVARVEDLVCCQR